MIRATDPLGRYSTIQDFLPLLLFFKAETVRSIETPDEVAVPPLRRDFHAGCLRRNRGERLPNAAGRGPFRQGQGRFFWGATGKWLSGLTGL